VSGEYAAEVVADLEQMVIAALPRWQLSSATEVRVLNLSENATFALHCPRRDRELVLRVHRIGYSAAGEIRSELAWIEALRNDGVVETVTPVAGDDGEFVQTLASPTGRAARQAVAFERLPGCEPNPTGEAASWFTRLGELTARMHTHARQWRPPEGFRRKRWHLAAMLGPEAFWGSWRAAAGLTAAGTAVIERATSLIECRLAQFGDGPDRFGLIHADLRLANLLVDGDHLRIIDFDDCGFSWFMYDFATAVSFMEEQPLVPALLAAWIEGYRRAAPLSPEEVAEIPTFVVLRRIVLSAWLASHAEVPAARQFGSAYTDGTVMLAQRLLDGTLFG
jgi:Ser/Thr protein kinase RdoA (MazF antagonist)